MCVYLVYEKIMRHIIKHNRYFVYRTWCVSLDQQLPGVAFHINPVDENPSTITQRSWPLVGNERMNPQYTNVKVDSLIPY